MPETDGQSSEIPAQLGVALLPVPRKIECFDGNVDYRPGCRLQNSTGDRRIDLAMERWGSEGKSRAREASEIRQAKTKIPETASRVETLRVVEDRASVSSPQGYTLRIKPERIEVVGGSLAGCFNGLQTLQQLARGRGGLLPCCEISDHPDFATRGVLLDVTRGRAATLSTLKRVVDRLANLKINQVHLYIEHAFVFPFDADICGCDDGLTPDEVKQLDAYCRERFIDLVPAIASPGHMGRILSMPNYRHLAEISAERTWEHMSWPQRMRGLTLDCVNPQAWDLVERIWSDILDAFESPVVNICGDEPWDLGKGVNRDRFAKTGTAIPYVNYLSRIHDLCANRGRRVQMWGDVVAKYPEHLHRLPTELTVLHWGYDDAADYQQSAKFVGAGLDTIVCPGTSGWKRILNANNLAERNIATFAKTGLPNGATGLLNTDWGDHGHFNQPAASAHGIALGAALGWNAGHVIGDDFDKLFADVVWDCLDADGVRLMRRASALADTCETWRLLWSPMHRVASDSKLLTPDQADEMEHASAAFRVWCEQASTRTDHASEELASLALAARFQELLARKLRYANSYQRAATKQSTPLDLRETWAQELMQAYNDYAASWNLHYKPSGLSDIQNALGLAAKDLSTS